MQKEFRKWRSPSLGRDMELMVYGDSGAPVLAFPTENGNHLEWEENGVIDELSDQIHLGYNQVFCVNGFTNKSLLNDKIIPKKRLSCHIQYESYIIEEVIPFINEQNEHFFLMAAGAGLGAYYAMVFGLKHPAEFDKLIGVSGKYDIRDILEDYYNDTVYYNNPVDFIPNLNDEKILKQIGNLDIRLVSYSDDEHRESTERMSRTLWTRVLDHRLDIWNSTSSSKWKLWAEMLKTHII